MEQFVNFLHVLIAEAYFRRITDKVNLRKKQKYSVSDLGIKRAENKAYRHLRMYFDYKFKGK